MRVIPIQLRWSDFDILRHVYNGKYQQFYDIGKTEYFAEVMRLNDGWDTTGEGLITASVSINYISPVELRESIEVMTSVEKIGTKSITVFQQIRNVVTDEIKSDCRTVLVGYNPETKTTYEIPEKWRKAISEEENQK